MSALNDGQKILEQVQRDVLVEQNQKLAQRLLEIRHMAESALNHLCEVGTRHRYDPSWIRPKLMSREELNESAIQAYHWIHKIVETTK